MQASVVIPVWNGASVLPKCLDALSVHSGDELLEVICVDNASSDESARLIATRYPQARLIREPVNLGFAGGVNAGIEVARGDVFVLLNQDCIVHRHWLEELSQALASYSEFGIAGCTIFHANGVLDHAGARLTHPTAIGEHITDIGDGKPRQVDYVTGAVMAIRRQTWNNVGRLDEGYYPAYYEECDYCYRARYKGIETLYVPRAQVSHLRASREAQKDPIKHWVNQQRSRYRFISKHFDGRELGGFFEAEYAAIASERYFDQSIGRLIGARDTLRGLADILERRRLDCGDDLIQAYRRQLEVGFTQVLRQSFATTEKLTPGRPIESLSRSRQEWQVADQRMQALLGMAPIRDAGVSASPTESKPMRLLRQFMLRPLGILIPRISRRRAASVTQPGLAGQIGKLHFELEEMYRLFQDQREQMDRRLTLLEYLVDYDYR